MLASAILGGMAAYDGGQPNAKLIGPQVLSSKPSGAVSGAKAKVDIPAPKNVFVPALPECASNRQVRPVRIASNHLFGKKVVLQGVLTFGGVWDCDCNTCGTIWRVVDARPRMASRPTPALVLQRSGERGVWHMNASARQGFPAPPDIAVVATGILRGTEQKPGYYEQFLLEDAQLCRLRRNSSSPDIHLTHPTDSVIDYLVGCGKL